MLLVSGLVTWAIAFMALPSPLAARIFLVAPLVLVPRLLATIPRRNGPVADRIARLAGLPSFVAALVLVAAFALPAGIVAAACCLPWVVITTLCGIGGLDDLRRGLPRILREAGVEDLAVDGALAALAVGGIFVALDRLAIHPLELGSAIVLLTAVHFHVLGFGLIAVAAAMARRGSTLAGLAACAALVGIAITAAGFTTGAEIANWAGSVVVGAGAMGIAGACIAVGVGTRSAPLPAARRAGMAIAGAALVCGVPMGVAWATASLIDLPFVDLDTMVRTHGALNGIGVTLAAVSWPMRSEP